MTQNSPLLGVIEGFYGQPWLPESRLAMMDWLAAVGLEAYLYAPKADSALRRNWREDWSTRHRSHLKNVASRCADSGLEFAIGLSPFALYSDYGAVSRAALKTKIARIADVGDVRLALLFDDMPGDVPDLAQRQLEIVHDVLAWMPGSGLRVCPTYYSDDPVLDQVFGDRPDAYLRVLGEGLPDTVELFWTGPQVCSTSVASTDLEPVILDSGCSLALWDNYPVNDSKLRSDHLYLAPLEGRSADLANCLGSHWCNAMNQPALSLPALASLPVIYGRGCAAKKADVYKEAGLDDVLISHCLRLTTEGLSTISDERRSVLQALTDGPGLARRELAAWLAGSYRFDPACLTD